MTDWSCLHLAESSALSAPGQWNNVPWRCRRKRRRGRPAWASAVVYSPPVPTRFETYHRKYAETAEEAPPTFCTWTPSGRNRWGLEGSSAQSTPLATKNKNSGKETSPTESYFAMRESVTTMARLKMMFRSTGSRMWRGDRFSFRAFFQSPPVTQRKILYLIELAEHT